MLIILSHGSLSEFFVVGPFMNRTCVLGCTVEYFSQNIRKLCSMEKMVRATVGNYGVFTYLNHSVSVPIICKSQLLNITCNQRLKLQPYSADDD